MPETHVQYQVERTPEGHFVKGQSGNPAGKPPGRCSHTSRTAEILLEGEVEALTRTAMARALEDSRIIAPRRRPCIWICRRSRARPTLRRDGRGHGGGCRGRPHHGRRGRGHESG